MSSVIGSLDNKQLRSLAKVMYYKEAEHIYYTNFKSEDELAHYLSHSKSNYQSVIGLLDSASRAAAKSQTATDATPAPADVASWHRANADLAFFILDSLNVAFQQAKDFNVRFYYVRKLRKYCKSLESRLLEMQPLNPSQPPAAEQTSPGDVPSSSDSVPDGGSDKTTAPTEETEGRTELDKPHDGGPDKTTAPAEETEGRTELDKPHDGDPGKTTVPTKETEGPTELDKPHDGGPDTKGVPAVEIEDPTELDKLLYGEHGETMEVPPETNVAEELANLRRASREYANAAINRAPGSTIDISEFDKQLERARVSLGYEKPFTQLKNGQKLEVFNKILEEKKVIKDLDRVGGVASAGMLLVTAVLIVWDVSAAPPDQKWKTLARESLVALGSYLAPEMVPAGLSAALDAAGVDVAGFAVALGVSEFVLSAVAIGTGIGIGILAGLAVGWLFDAIDNYESSYPLSTEGHKVFVVPQPDVKDLARRIAAQSFENATDGRGESYNTNRLCTRSS